MLLVLAVLGGAVAAGLQAALGLRVEGKDVPAEPTSVAPERAFAPPPRWTTLDVPTGDERLDLAAAELRRASRSAGAPRGTASLRVRHGNAADGDGYAVALRGTRLDLTAPSRAGAVRGVYELAQAVGAGRPLADLAGEHPTSRLPFRMVDLGAAGVTPDPDEWRDGDDYSHRSGAFDDVVLGGPPYVDDAALADASASVERYVEHVLAQGHNAITVPGLLEYVTFADVPGVYEADDEHVARARAMRAAFGPVWQRAHDLGLRVYLRFDMLALTPPLRAYLADRYDLDTEDPRLWEVYAAALDEVYREMPYVDGIVVRVGEAGDVYDTPGLDYTSELAVTTVPAVRAMLTAFTDQAERADREVVFRTWSVGVGAVGDMHTNRESYEAVLGGLDSDRLVVSTKYSLGDFYRHLPYNDTLEVGEHRRIVELQSRREFEGQGALPDDLGVLHQQALQRFVAANPRVEGVWTWTQDGGPWRAGPFSLLLTTGFWQLYDLNSEVAARLAVDPDADVAEATADWARRTLSRDPATVRAVGEALALSPQVIGEGLYVGPYADRRVFALGLEPPPMMWVFEWDILTGDSAVLDVVYAVTRDSADGRDGVETAIREGDDALAGAERMRALVAGTDPASWRDAEVRERFVAALDFQVSLLRMLGAYRAMVLRHAQWLDGEGSREAWSQAREAFGSAADAHERAYAGDLALPAWNLTAARLGLERAERDLPMAWAARGLLVVALGWLLIGALGRVPAARVLWLAGTRPWRAAEAVRDLPRGQRALLVAVPLGLLAASRLVFTWFAAPAHLLAAGLGWLGLVAVLAVAVRLLRADPWPVLAAVGGAVVLRVVLLLVVLAPRGPGGYWFAFWTSPGRRSAYVAVAFVALGWVLVAAAWALRPSVSRRRAAGAAVAAAGGAVVVPALLVALVGLEPALSAWNDQLALLPWGLHRILGLTVYLGVPAGAAWWASAAGAGVMLLGVVLTAAPSRTRQAGTRSRPRLKFSA
ncbi:hypothetical protein GCM10023340_10680 [Nocardioides marinquilinus]|uniref:Glycosyl hydrolase family 67 C-terminal domain-containing protein n=1 Tax=Nocardioides marinquilinus TaxID=1210400 RepID=A0ABP9PDC8_9ACTN